MTGPPETSAGAEAVEAGPAAAGPAAVPAGAGVTADAAARPRVRPNARMLLLLATGHLTVDSMQGALPAILPVLREAHGLTYEAAGVIVLVANLTSSVIQPAFGYLSDRSARRWLLPWAVLCATVGFALVGVAPGYPVILALTVLAGLGIAAYHPEGYKTAGSVAGDWKATGVSWFSVGGNIGIATGPLLITLFVQSLGLPGTLAMLGHGLVVTGLLFAVQPYLARESAARRAASASAAPAMLGAMVLLVIVVMVRSWTQLGFTTYVPFYYRDYLKADPWLVGPLLFVFLGAGALGTLIGGPMADRFGARRFTVGAFALATPLAVAFLLTSGWVHFLILGALGFVLVSTFTTSVVLAHAYLPRQQGMASGLIVGLAIGAGGLGAWLLGAIADRWDLTAALWVAALTPAAGFVLALFLPEPKRG
jgi:MFS transporter, FSR family, fosmidomycin resistance protein